MSNAEAVVLDPFIHQYQMADTACCVETIRRSVESRRWNESVTTGGSDRYDRDSTQLPFTAESPAVEHEPILEFAQECLTQYLAVNKFAGNVPRFGLREGYNVLRYKPGEAYHGIHSDHGWPNLAHRHLTMGIFLNTITQGGELEFPAQDLKVKPVAGRAVLFPAAWTHAHRSLPCGEERFVFNIFYGYLPESQS